MYRLLSSRYEQATRGDILAFGCFFLSAIACLGMSATFHMISNHSESVCTFSNKLDHLGIVLLIWGSFVPSIFYGFACEPGLLSNYLTMVCNGNAGSEGKPFYGALTRSLRSPLLRQYVQSQLCLRSSERLLGGRSAPPCLSPWAFQQCFRSFTVSCGSGIRN